MSTITELPQQVRQPPPVRHPQPVRQSPPVRHPQPVRQAGAHVPRTEPIRATTASRPRYG